MVQISTSIGFDRPFCAVAFSVKIYDLETKVLALHPYVQSEEFFCRYEVLLIWRTFLPPGGKILKLLHQIQNKVY